MKLWFTEPRPNVFVSGITDAVSKTVVEYLVDHCPPESGVMIFRSTPEPPGHEIRTIGPTRKDLVNLTGLSLVVETLKS